MVIELSASRLASRAVPARHVYLMASVCLILGLGAGYTVRGSRMPASPATPAVRTVPFLHPGIAAQPRPSLEQLQQMADRQIAPLLERLQTDPNNTALLTQVGALYHATHQYQQAARYYGRAVQADPKNVVVRNKLAASLYRNGDADGAIAQLDQALTYDANDANSLFNLGMVKWEGKQDATGALTAWKQLLKANPHLSPDRKATVQELMAQAAPRSAARNQR
jgi:cytochrome c-type biogenesis protein CcmH/NrfG